MEPKISREPRILPVPPGEVPMPELEGWDPPFERWIRMADALLGRSVGALPKVTIPCDLKSMKH
jgi:hypothetical protein